MEITQATIALGKSINLGNYQSLRVDVSLTATMSQDEYDGDGMMTLETEVRKELAYRLWDYAEAELKGIRLLKLEEKDREERAIRRSAEFASMMEFHPDAARELLAALVEEEEQKAAEAEIEQRRMDEEKAALLKGIAVGTDYGDPEHADDDEESSDMDDPDNEDDDDPDDADEFDDDETDDADEFDDDIDDEPMPDDDVIDVGEG